MRKTSQVLRTEKAIRAWCGKQGLKVKGRLRHVHARAYVVGKGASSCLVVAVPWVDSEPQLKNWDKQYPLDVIHAFDDRLKAGDWCSTAYVSHQGGNEKVAVMVVE